MICEHETMCMQLLVDLTLTGRVLTCRIATYAYR